MSTREVMRPRVVQLEARVVELERELATWQAMGKALHELGLRQIKLPEVHFDEDRIDIIGPNGNDRLHYQEK